MENDFKLTLSYIFPIEKLTISPTQIENISMDIDDGISSCFYVLTIGNATDVL